MHQILRVVRCLKLILYKAVTTGDSPLFDEEPASHTGPRSHFESGGDIRKTTRQAVFRLIVAVLADLYARWL